MPEQLAVLFESAFAEAGARLGRPTASQWVGMLDYLRHNLRSCATEPVHNFFGGAHSCPWCELEEGGIPKIGSTRSAALASFGIETAADVDEYRILAIPGFGPSLTAQIVGWRRGLERRFVFDPAKGVDPADVLALDHRFRQKRQQLEGELLAGVESLNSLRAEALARARALRPEADNAAACFAQAQADFSIA